jgi:hypothetical protein
VTKAVAEPCAVSAPVWWYGSYFNSDIDAGFRLVNIDPIHWQLL